MAIFIDMHLQDRDQAALSFGRKLDGPRHEKNTTCLELVAIGCRQLPEDEVATKKGGES